MTNCRLMNTGENMRNEIKQQAKKWAELFVESEQSFLDDFKTTVDSKRYEPVILGLIISLSQCYYNLLSGRMSKEDAQKYQNNLLDGF